MYVHVWLLNNCISLKWESSQFLILLKQTNMFKPQQSDSYKTRLDFKLELISLFTNYSRVIACCFVLLISSSSNQFFSYFELVHIHWFILSTAVGCRARNTKANCVTLLVRSGGQSLTSLRFYQRAPSQTVLSSGVLLLLFPLSFPLLHLRDRLFPCHCEASS